MKSKANIDALNRAEKLREENEKLRAKLKAEITYARRLIKESAAVLEKSKR